ncbi:baeRF12 domain-containing protein [Erythrobacter ani]|uniref:Host attachment protein n=1 Tax=Erythrobacter ani TaxID=2827235 RepID=A0ABS6SKJ4_9SPHN|nr:host attachment protein [Erythrobacter ani]MBV7265500.1 host attachment protein [Erythrobacter ani]
MKLKHGALVMAIDGRKMVLLRNQGDTRKPVLQTVLQEISENPRSGEQGSDRPGRTFSSASSRRSAMSETDWHEEAKKNFVRDALGVLAAYRKEQGSEMLVLAAPSVLGEFRKQCPDSLKPGIIAEIDKDVVNHRPEEIVAIIDAVEP